MNYRQKLGFLVLSLYLSTCAIAESITVKEHVIDSEVLAEQQKFTVFLPDTYHKYPDEKYPVFYFLDGQYYKDMVRGLMSSYYENGLAPTMILVAIENQDRVRDYTPSIHAVYKQGGGADVFLDYIAKELQPFVDENYQTSDFRILNGHSLGGLFALHSMHARPDLFTAYIALSPSLHWGDQATLKSLISYLSSEKAFNQFLYVNLGDEGYQVSATTTKLMRASFLELEAFLQEKQPKGLRFKTELMQTLPHVGTLMTGLVNANNELYRHWYLPFRVMEQGPEGVKKHFQRLSQDLFYDVKPRERAVDFAAEYVTYDAGGPEKGLELLKYNAQLYPDSANALFNLAKGYKSVALPKQSKQAALQALQKIKTSDKKDLKQSIENFLDELDAKTEVKK